jgi:4-hydroxybenzoate polyprenyltransferase
LKLVYFLKLIRWPNLAIIAFTLVILRYCILIPLLDRYGLNLQLSNFVFFLLVLSTILLAAAGYIINDVYDVDSDKVNKPGKVIVGKYFTSQFAEYMSIILNILAVIIGIYISYKIGIRSVGVIFLLVAGLLYFYSTTYKSQLILGNLMVAFFAAVVPMMVVLFELPLLTAKYKTFISSSFNFNFLIAWFGFYSFFAFLISLIREIVKDMEDFEGDSAYGQKTLPVAFGMGVSKFVVVFLTAITLAFLVYLVVKYLYQLFALLYILPFILTPVIIIGWLTILAKEKKDYTTISKICKILMLAGILFAVMARYVFL